MPRLILILLFALPAASAEWSFHTEGPVRSSPAVTADTVYIGSDDGFLYAIARASGRLRWRFHTRGPVNASPAVARDLVFIASDDGFVYALRAADGYEQWRVATGKNMTPRWGWEYFASSPVIAGSALFIGGNDGYLRSIEAATGRVLWSSLRLGGKIRSTPAVIGDRVVIGSDAGRVYAFDRTTGAAVWTFETEGAAIDSEKAGFDRRSIHASPAINGDEVVIGSRDSFVYGIDLATGKQRWRVEHKDYSWVMASAAVRNDLAIVGTSDAHSIEAVDRSGSVKWTVDTPSRVFSSAAVVGDRIYVGCQDGSLIALDAATGEARWRFWIGAETSSSPVVRDGIVYIGADDGNVYAVTAAPTPRKRALFGPDTRSYWFHEGTQLRDYAKHAGYDVVDAGGLATFLRDRVEDRQPSVVLFASEKLPVADSLLKSYMESGGRVAWFGLPPYSIANGYEPSRATQFLDGVAFEAAARDHLRVHPTKEGRDRGLESWWIASGEIPVQPGMVPLAVDEFGRAAVWSKSFGAGEFLMIGGDIIGMDLERVIRLAESPTGMKR